jgi:hypothetical protein
MTGRCSRYRGAAAGTGVQNGRLHVTLSIQRRAYVTYTCARMLRGAKSDMTIRTQPIGTAIQDIYRGMKRLQTSFVPIVWDTSAPKRAA